MNVPTWPMLASEHGADTNALFLTVHGLMAVLFVGWLVFFVYALVRFRRGRQPKADYRGARTWIPYYLVAAIFLIEMALDFGWAMPIAEHRAAQALDEENAVVVRVVAQQYAWNIHYPGEDGVFGPGRPDLVDDQTNPLGLDFDAEAAKDDIVMLNQLYLPVNKRVVAYITSKDVIHAFNVPEFRVKQDAIPGMATPIGFTPTMTTAEFREAKSDPDRTFEIACAQLCGLGHYNMRGRVMVLTAEEFATWLEENKPSGEVDPFWDF